MGADHDVPTPAPSRGAMLLIESDFPRPFRSWYQVIDGWPVLFLRKDLYGDLAVIQDAYEQAAQPRAAI